MHCLSQNLQSHSLAVGHKKRCNETSFHKICNVTYTLLGIAKGVIRIMRLPFTKCEMLLTSWWSCDETAFHKLYSVTHLLSVIGKEVMRLPFTKCEMSLTRCW